MDEQPICNIVGQKVALGPWRSDLVPLYQRWMNDLEIIRNLAVSPLPMSLEREQDFYDKIARETGSAFFTVYECATGRAVGNVSLGLDHRNRRGTLGILIGEADCRGRGYGTEAVCLLLDYGFYAQGLNNIMLSVYEFNLAAQRCYQKAGFREIGRRRQCCFMGGRLWDEIFMDILAEEFESPVLAGILRPDEKR